MAEKLIKTIIQLRRDTEANLTAQADVLILRAGEPCVTLDGEHKGQIKIGDGTSTWGQLEYMSVDATGIDVDGTSISNQDGILTILGYGTATQGQQPRKGASGLEWFTPALTDEQLTDLNEAVNGEDGLVNKVESLEDTVTNPDTGLNKVVTDLSSSVTNLTNNLTNNYYDKTAVDNKIDTALSSTYKAGGSVEGIDDITVDAAHSGYVYDVSNAFTTTDAFIEGAGHSYPAGTNVAVVEIPAEGDGEPTYKLDTMSGFVDLSNYVEESVQGTNGTSYVWNEQTGGGARFVHTDGTESFVGVNDGGENGMVAQIYADKQVDGNWVGSRINVYQKGIFYHNAEDKASDGYVADDPNHEIATKGDVAEVSSASTANKTILDSLPKQMLVDLVNVSRNSTTNTAEIQIAVKQSDGTYTTSDHHGVLTLVGADMLNAGLMTASDKNKLDGIQINAEKNKINMIMVDAKEQPIAAGAVNISCAMSDGSEAGVVYSSSDMNKVYVDEDGIMEVNNVSVEKLVVPEGTNFILDGGNASSAG